MPFRGLQKDYESMYSSDIIITMEDAVNVKEKKKKRAVRKKALSKQKKLF